jgi:hypothetical protein
MRQSSTEEHDSGNEAAEETSSTAARIAQIAATAWLALVLFLFAWLRIWSSATVTHWLDKLGGR